MGTVVGGEGHGSCKPKGTPQNYKKTHVTIFASVETEREREREGGRERERERERELNARALL